MTRVTTLRTSKAEASTLIEKPKAIETKQSNNSQYKIY